MILKENKLKHLIRQIIREMAFNPNLSNQGGDWSSYDMTDLKTKNQNQIYDIIQELENN